MLYEENRLQKKSKVRRGKYDDTPDVVLCDDLYAPIVLECAAYWKLKVEEDEETNDDQKWTTGNKKAIEKKTKAASLVFSLRKFTFWSVF